MTGETPYIQTISDEELAKMIERRRRIASVHRSLGDFASADIAGFHYHRAVEEKIRRLIAKTEELKND